MPKRRKSWKWYVGKTVRALWDNKWFEGIVMRETKWGRIEYGYYIPGCDSDGNPYLFGDLNYAAKIIVVGEG